MSRKQMHVEESSMHPLVYFCFCKLQLQIDPLLSDQERWRGRPVRGGGGEEESKHWHSISQIVSMWKVAQYSKRNLAQKDEKLGESALTHVMLEKIDR